MVFTSTQVQLQHPNTLSVVHNVHIYFVFAALRGLALEALIVGFFVVADFVGELGFAAGFFGDVGAVRFLIEVFFKPGLTFRAETLEDFRGLVAFFSSPAMLIMLKVKKIYLLKP
jgi:hypothetical protein